MAESTAPAAAATTTAAPAEEKVPAVAPVEDDEEDEGEEGEETVAAGGAGGAEAGEGKKKKRRKHKKKKAAATGESGTTAAATATTDAPAPKAKQTAPPTIPVATLFDAFPKGKILSYAEDYNTFRETSEEKRSAERLFEARYEDARHAAEVHREVRKWAKTWLRPGLAMVDIADRIEGAIRKISAGGLGGGIAFPCGLSLNNCAAHYTPNSGDTTVLTKDDVMKVDIGVHVNGTIIDSAFTVAFDPKYDNLLAAVKDATNTGVQKIGVDVKLSEVGEAIQEVMESYEMEVEGKMQAIKPIRNLYGHSLGLYRIHAGKSVPIVKTRMDERAEEGDFFAIETFGSTGTGHVSDGGDCSHYMRNFDAPDRHPSLRGKAKDLYAMINQNHGTLAFAKRWLEMEGATKGYQIALKSLCDNGLVVPYPPLLDVRGSHVAQFEHTVVLKPTCKEVLSFGGDY